MNGDAKHLLFLEGDVRLTLSEWVPVGSHFINELHRRFGCYSLRQAVMSSNGVSQTPFFITSAVDHQPHGAIAAVPRDQESKVRVKSHKHLKFICFEGKIESLETGGELQDEQIGVEISHEGHICYGMRVDRSSDGENRASLDVLSSIAADLTYDSSQLMNSLFNGYQRRLLDVVHQNQSNQRRKWLILAAGRLRDAEGLDVSPEAAIQNPAFATELRQVLGAFDAESVVPLDKRGMIVFGEQGVLCVDSSGSGCLRTVMAYGLMSSMVSFLDNVFRRVAYCWDKLKSVHDTAEAKNANEMVELQTDLSRLADDQAILNSVTRHMKRDFEHVAELLAKAQIVEHAAEFHLNDFADLHQTFSALKERLDDLDILLDTLGRSIENVRTFVSALNERETFGINRAMNILTVVSVIVLPLTLIAGIYGMNFQAYDLGPDTRVVAFWNMPELRWAYGYPLVILLMLGIAACLFGAFLRLGLLWPQKKREHQG